MAQDGVGLAEEVLGGRGESPEGLDEGGRDLRLFDEAGAEGLGALLDKLGVLRAALGDKEVQLVPADVLFEGVLFLSDESGALFHPIYNPSYYRGFI